MYKSQIFTAIDNDKKHLGENIRRLPDINYSFLIGNSTEIISPDTPTPHIIYIIQQLVNNNNSLLDKLLFYESHQLPMIQSQLDVSLNQVLELKRENEEKEKEINILKRLLSQASSTINNTEVDYELLRREISLVTEKVSALMDENQVLKSKLSHIYISSSINTSTMTPPHAYTNSTPLSSVSSTARPTTPNSTTRLVSHSNPSHPSYGKQY